MTGTAFTVALFAGTAAVAVWLVARYPDVAPSSVVFRGVAPIAASFAVRQIRIDTSDRLHLYVSLFLICFPLLVASWVTALWLLQALRDLTTRL
jgi:hypothetical protein